ncbi:hypothetical protein QN277_013779 [Acacia crassicarpa]|uniref:Uncharacterized protein n=1 Tax=Acacia crassicarpa TaxID=499986 RepID=A0AAE1N439_9FABA|nr:hypothetical protein QN277_013779 [Acacia crassicarpa]
MSCLLATSFSNAKIKVKEPFGLSVATLHPSMVIFHQNRYLFLLPGIPPSYSITQRSIQKGNIGKVEHFLAGIIFCVYFQHTWLTRFNKHNKWYKSWWKISNIVEVEIGPATSAISCLPWRYC